MSFVNTFRSALAPKAQASTAQQATAQETQKGGAKDTVKTAQDADAYEPKAKPSVSLDGGYQDSVDVSVEEGSASVEANATLNGSVKGPKGIGVSVEVSADASIEKTEESEDGYTTYTVTADASVTVSGEVNAGSVGFGANQTEGLATTYQVRMTDEDFAKVESGEIPPPNPFDPSTMPPGTTIMMDSSEYSETGMSASFQQIRAESNVEDSEGTSMVFEMGEDDQLTVTAGPTEAVKNAFQLGLSLGPLSAHVGKTSTLETYNLQTATFDLDTDDGKGSYGEFLVTGDMPEQNSEGVSDAATIEKLAFSSVSTAGITIGSFDLSGEIGATHYSQVKTTLADGTATLATDFDLHPGNIPVHLEQHFKDGTEDVSAQQMTMTLADMDDGYAAYVYAAFSGLDHDAALAKVKGDHDLTVTLTQEDVETIIQQAQDFIADDEKSGKSWDEDQGKLEYRQVIQDIANAEDLADVALILAEVNSQEWLAEGLLIMTGPIGDETELHPLAGEVTVA